MDEQALRQIFSDFLTDFERVLDDHVTEMRDLLRTDSTAELRDVALGQSVEQIVADVAAIRTELEVGRNG